MFEEKFDYKEDLFETGFDYASTRKPVRKLFFRWKDVNDHTWIEMTGIEYFEFVKSEEGKKHFFIPEIDPYHEADTIVHEVTESDFKKWDSEREQNWQLWKDMNAPSASDGEKKHRRNMPLITNVISLDTKIDCDDDDESISLHDIVADPDSLFEDKLIARITVREMMKVLLPEEKDVIIALFFENENNESERKVAAKLGIPQHTFNDRKTSAFRKCKKFLKNF